jgi:hypothetical protein
MQKKGFVLWNWSLDRITCSELPLLSQGKLLFRFSTP